MFETTRDNYHCVIRATLSILIEITFINRWEPVPDNWATYRLQLYWQLKKNNLRTIGFVLSLYFKAVTLSWSEMTTVLQRWIKLLTVEVFLIVNIGSDDICYWDDTSGSYWSLRNENRPRVTHHHLQRLRSSPGLLLRWNASWQVLLQIILIF